MNSKVPNKPTAEQVAAKPILPPPPPPKRYGSTPPCGLHIDTRAFERQFREAVKAVKRFAGKLRKQRKGGGK